MYILTVTEMNTYLRELLDAEPVLSDVWVEGEISNFKRHTSGHCYFSLKEGDAVLNAVMWKSYALRLGELPHNGDAVLAHGRVSFYEVGGKLQLYVDTLRAAGVGFLHAQFEELKQRLDAEGLFDISRKRALPLLPRRVGIVTSGKGAALQDMLNVLARRCPLVEVLISPCLVQGEQAPGSIAAALQALYATDVDLIIVARGGGSIEDLWAFNTEEVARAIFAGSVPLITGIGHETDTTIADYVADLRAPTPSAAAELAVPEQTELRLSLAALHRQLDAAFALSIDTRRRQLAAAHDRLRQHNPAIRLPHARQQVDDLLRRAEAQLQYGLTLRQTQLQGLQAQLSALSPRATLERGYAVVRQATNGTVVTQSTQVGSGETLVITLKSGKLVADVVESQAEESA
jgi:exodeoxyribonuclease VII large subunit